MPDLVYQYSCTVRTRILDLQYSTVVLGSYTAVQHRSYCITVLAVRILLYELYSTVLYCTTSIGASKQIASLQCFMNGQFCVSKILCRGQHILAQQRAHQRIQTQSLHTLDFMQVRVRGLGSHTRRARNRPSKGHPAPKRRRW